MYYNIDTVGRILHQTISDLPHNLEVFYHPFGGAGFRNHRTVQKGWYGSVKSFFDINGPNGPEWTMIILVIICEP